jgi:hypothetical protein
MMWEKTLLSYQEVSKEKIEIEKNLNKLRGDLRKEELAEIEKHHQKTFETAQNWIEKRKELYNLTMQEEIKAWEAVTGQYVEGTKQRAEADKRLYDARKALQESEKKAYADIATAQEEYGKAAEEKTRSNFNLFGLFEEVNFTETSLEQIKKMVPEAQSA